MSVYKREGVWYYDITFDGRRYRSRAGTTKAQAQRNEAKKRTELFEGTFNTRPKHTALTLEELRLLWLERLLAFEA